ncbi:MAG: phosphoribosyl-AMP cyclohydrolase [Crenarchaeota archaeon]|nr:phosphoribosyl-AMP cyclohydrolase [Thermoproteota archaeon]MDW8033504.1 phosphoribosyl-AMP cyclohydrolase [Nitrososphaerota archaeon]
MTKLFRMSSVNAMKLVSKLVFKNGLIPAVAKNNIGMVLMIGFMNKESLLKTLTTGYMHYYSRTRKKIWMKGEESGFKQRVLEVRVNCENNSLLFTVEQEGPGACHMGYETCFYRKASPRGVFKKVEEKRFNPRKVYGLKFKKIS